MFRRLVLLLLVVLVSAAAARAQAAEGDEYALAAKIVPIDLRPGDAFGGREVAVDGDLAVIGAFNANAAYVYQRTEAGWAARQRLGADDGASGDHFGWGTAVDSSTETVVISANQHATETGSGAVYVFRYEAGGWSEAQQLVGPDPDAGPYFGDRVSLSGDTMVIQAGSATVRDASGQPLDAAGAAYVYERDPISGSYALQQRVHPVPPGAGDQVTEVNLSGSTLVLGSYRDDNENGLDAGSAHVFRYDGDAWVHQQRLIAFGESPARYFGNRVEVDGDWLAVGAEDRAYIFHWSGQEWVGVQVIESPAPAPQFSIALALVGDRLLLGDYIADGVVPGSGGVWMYGLDVDRWVLLQSVHAPDGAGNDMYGISADMDASTVVVGAFNDDGHGSAYIWQRDLNSPPLADAGADVTHYVGSPIALDGSASSDPEGDPLSYQWAIASAPAGSLAALVDATTPAPGLTPDLAGDYVIELVVSDGAADSAPDTVLLTVLEPGAYAEMQLEAGDALILDLPAGSLDVPGHRDAMSDAVTRITDFIDEGNTAQAIRHLEKLIERTDGCALRGAPDASGGGNTPAADYVTTCAGQAELYPLLIDALAALTG